MIVLEKKHATQASTYQVEHAPKLLQYSLAHNRKDWWSPNEEGMMFQFLQQ
jgi:hypothetical protein